MLVNDVFGGKRAMRMNYNVRVKLFLKENLSCA